MEHRDSDDENDRTISFPFSSEEPVERFFGVEVLDHEPSSVDLSRLQDGAPLLFNHDPDQIIGVVETAKIENGRGIAKARFSKSKDGEEKLGMVKEGILRNVSVGYRIEEVEPDKDGNGNIIERVVSWTPFEVSMVAIPADATVGVSRASTDTPNKVKVRQMTEPTTQTPTVPPPDKAEMDRRIKEATASATKVEQERAREIRATAIQCKRIKDVEGAADKFIEEGKSADEFRKWVVAHQEDSKPPQSSPDIGMSNEEIRDYSIVRAINQQVNGGLEGLEKAAHEACLKQYNTTRCDGFWVPWDVQRVSLADAQGLNDSERRFYNGKALQNRSINRTGRRDLSAGVDAAGGFTVQTDVLGQSLIELLRNNMVTAELGIQMMTGLQGDVAIPRQSGAGTASWEAEGALAAESDQAFEQVPLVPHRLHAATAYTKQLLIQATIDVESFVRDDIAATQALAIDLAIINGSGAGAEPEGILNATGTGALTFGVGAPSWAKVVEFETTLQAANARRGNVAFVTSPAVQGAWKTTVQAATFPIYLLDAISMTANGYAFQATTQYPDDTVIFGNWNDVILASWGGIDIVVNPFSLDAANSIRVTVNTHNDTVLRHPESFVVSTDAGNQS